MENYTVLEPIGRGSFGQVHKVRRKTDGKILVCKSMAYGGMSEREKQLIVSEVNILRTIKHPHVVQYVDRVIDKKSTKIYILMEYCEGGDLGKQIKRRKRERKYFDEPRIWKLFAQLLLAFEACHSNREGSTPKPILHRDVKPGNILIDAHGNAKLGDFGLAKELTGESRFAYTNVGTPYYMPPEMVNEAKYNEKVDIWSIGCLIYEMAALRPPFEAKNVVALGKKINAGVFQRIPSCFSKELQTTVELMLQLSPSKRPSVLELLKLPMIRRYITESKFQRERLSNKYDVMIAEIKRREEELKRREHEIEMKEKKIVSREEEIIRQTSDLRHRERMLKIRETKTPETPTTPVSSSKCIKCGHLSISPSISPFSRQRSHEELPTYRRKPIDPVTPTAEDRYNSIRAGSPMSSVSSSSELSSSQSSDSAAQVTMRHNFKKTKSLDRLKTPKGSNTTPTPPLSQHYRTKYLPETTTPNQRTVSRRPLSADYEQIKSSLASRGMLQTKQPFSNVNSKNKTTKQKSSSELELEHKKLSAGLARLRFDKEVYSTGTSRVRARLGMYT